MTINEALAWQKTLRERQAELVAMRDQNANRTRRYYPTNSDKDSVQEPVYDVKALDRLVAAVARELRLVDLAVKRTNAATALVGYDHSGDIAELGTVE